MGRVNRPILSESEKIALEEGLKTGESHTFRIRCQVILLKSSGRTSQEVGEITHMTDVSVNSWVRRYNQEGLSGLATKPGRGRKPKLDKATDGASVIACVKSNRQRIQTAKSQWEQASGKSVSLSTFKTFLKVLVEDTNA